MAVQRTRNKTCRCCGKSFKGVLSSRFCSAACRQKAYRARKSPPKRKQRQTPPARPAHATICLHCGEKLWTSNPKQQYCCVSCRNLAHRQLRSSAIETYASVLGVSLDKAADVADIGGIRPIRRFLEQRGYCYSHTANLWINSHQMAIAS